MVISHNLMAMNAQRQLNIVNTSKKKSVEKLSSGYKINRAADDAAGLSISEKMRKQIRGLDQATRNIQDGVSFVQVADGALAEVQDMLQRVNELSIKSANGTNSATDRIAIDNEVKELKEEINRIFETTKFNDQRIWDEKVIPVESTVTVTDVTNTFPAVTFKSVPYTYIYTDNNNAAAIPRSSVTFSADDAGIKAHWTGYNGTAYESKTIPWDGQLSGNHSFKLSDYMDYSVYPEAQGVDFVCSYSVNEYSTLDQVKDSFNSGRFTLSRNVSNGVNYGITLADPSKSSIASMSASINYDAMLASGKNFEALDESFIQFKGMVNPALDDVADSVPFSFEFDMKNIGTVRTTSVTVTYTGDIVNRTDMSDRTGEGVWWQERKLSDGSKYKSQLSHSISSASLDGILSAINNDSGESIWRDNTSGGSISMRFILSADNSFSFGNSGSTKSVGSMTFSINISNKNFNTESELLDYIKEGLANISGVKINDNDNASRGYGYVYRSSDVNSLILASETHQDVTTEWTYFHDNNRDIRIQSGADAECGIHIKYENMNTELLGIGDLNVLDIPSSEAAIEQVSEALAKVSAERSNFGAYQNRLEHAIKGNRNTSENTQAAESRIRDTDMADEMVKYSTHNILEQVGTSMLAQTKQISEGVLSLLQ